MCKKTKKLYQNRIRVQVQGQNCLIQEIKQKNRIQGILAISWQYLPQARRLCDSGNNIESSRK